MRAYPSDIMANIFKRTIDILRGKEPSTIDKDTVWPWATPADGDATNVSAVYQCVNVISKNVARLPLRLYKRSASGVFVPDNTDWLQYILGIQPNERQSAYDFWNQTVQQMKMTGMAVIIPQWSENIFGDSRSIRNLDRLVLCSPGSAHYDYTTRGWKVYDELNGIHRDFMENEVVVLREPSRNGVEGVSPVTHARITISTILAGDTETRERFKKGGNVKGFISNEAPAAAGYNKYTKKQMEDLSAQKDIFFQSGGMVTWLPGGTKFNQLMMTSADMQFLESRKFAVKEICRWFGVSPSFVFEGATANSQESQKVRSDFVTDTLEPLLVQIETELRRKLFSWKDSVTHRLQFDRMALASSDPKAAVDLAAARIAAGIDTINEAREALGRTPVEDGDTILMSANLKSLSALLADPVTNQIPNKQNGNTGN